MAHENIITMKLMIINGCVYNIHPVYNLYTTNNDGIIINIVKQNQLPGNEKTNGYWCVVLKKNSQNGNKT